MEPFIKHHGIVALLDRQNVDTDQIIPKQFLKKISKSGFGIHLFHDWRFLDNQGQKDNPQFELNNPKFKGASILVAGDNFGCGSSREHVPWGLLDYGFKVVISTSFADIFFNNCFKNGILPIKVSEQELANLMNEISQDKGVSYTVDLEKERIKTPGGLDIHFEIDSFKKSSLLQGLNDIGWTLQYEDKIQNFETQQKQNQPWLWNSG